MRYRPFAFVSLCIAALAVAFAGIGSAIDRGLRWAGDALLSLAPEPGRLELAGEGYVDYHLHGDPLPAQLLNSLRHESRIANVGAPRHT